MSNVHSRMVHKPYVTTRARKIHNAPCIRFYHNGVAGVPLTRVLSGGEDFVDCPHAPVGIPYKEKIRLCAKYQDKDPIDGKQIRILHGKSQKTRAELLYGIGIMFFGTLSLDTFIEPFGVHIGDIYIMNLLQLTVGTWQVTLDDGTSPLRINRTEHVPGQLTDGSNGPVMHATNPPIYTSPVIDRLEVSSTAALPTHPTPPGSHTPHHNPTDGYRIGSQPPWPHAPVAVASSSRLPTDDASLHTSDRSHSLTQPIGWEDGIPNPSIYYPLGGGTQEHLCLPGYGNGGHEQPAYYRYTDSEFDWSDLNSWPGHDGMKPSTDALSSPPGQYYGP